MLTLRSYPDYFGPLHHTLPTADAGGDEVTLSHLQNVVSWQLRCLRQRLQAPLSCSSQVAFL